MHSSIEDWKNGWQGIELALAPEEIDKLIELLKMLKADHEQHFHISSDYKESGGIGEITISVKNTLQTHNIFLSGLALEPGDEIA